MKKTIRFSGLPGRIVEIDLHVVLVEDRLK